MSEWLQVQGVPMCRSLALKFIERNLATVDGFVIDAERFLVFYNENVCPTHEYYFLVETFDEMISVFQIIVKFTVSITPARNVLPDSFLIASIILDPISLLTELVGYKNSLTLGWPDKTKSDYYYAKLRLIRRKYTVSFPSHGMRELSRMMRLCSWVLPSNDSIP